MKTLSFLHVVLAGALAFLSGPGRAQQPADFAWRAVVQVPGDAPAARLELPAQAFLQLHSAAMDDVRVFNAAGQPVAFALVRPTAAEAAPVLTPWQAAHPLRRSGAVTTAATGVRVQLVQPDGQMAWVDLGRAAESQPAQEPQRLPAVLIDTRGNTAVLQGLEVEANLPADTPVPLQAAVSADLVRWTPLALQGSLFRFEEAQGLRNTSLAFEAPRSLQGHYLKLEWPAGAPVAIRAVRFALQKAASPQQRVAPLSPGTVQAGGLEWTLEAPTAAAALALTTQQANALVPVRVLGKGAAGEPWRVLAQGMVYPLGTAQATSASAPLPLAGARVHRLRLEPLQGLPLPADLSAALVFDAVQVVFLAQGAGPFTVAVGRAGTPAAALAPRVLAAALPMPLQALPAALLIATEVRAPAVRSAWTAWLPADASPQTALLWAVLALGVLALAGVAWVLLRQLKSPNPPSPPEGR